MNRCLLAALLVFTQFACGSDDVKLDGDGSIIDPNRPDADPNAPDADPNAPDADPNAPDATPSTCVANGAQCNNCMDDDSDGAIDGADPECTSLDDDDEGSFATGIPGDNKDAVWQDCFFDGDSGGGNDGCDLHICCLLPGDCPADLKPAQYDPDQCVQTAECIANCGGITPVGCDCFGCCTICVDGNCNDILTNPGIYLEETCANFPTPTEGQCCEAENQAGCYSCTKSADCGAATCDDDPNDCILCPGQTEADLPASCTGVQECPDGAMVCDQTADCGTDKYCNNGCCVDAIIID